MKTALFSLILMLLTCVAPDTQAKGMGGGAGRMQGQGMGQGNGGQGMSMQQGGDMDRDRTRLRQQQTPGQYQDGSQQQFRDMNQEQNRVRQMAPGAYQDGSQQQFREMISLTIECMVIRDINNANAETSNPGLKTTYDGLLEG